MRRRIVIVAIVAIVAIVIEAVLNPFSINSMFQALWHQTACERCVLRFPVQQPISQLLKFMVLNPNASYAFSYHFISSALH